MGCKVGRRATPAKQAEKPHLIGSSNYRLEQQNTLVKKKSSIRSLVNNSSETCWTEDVKLSHVLLSFLLSLWLSLFVRCCSCCCIIILSKSMSVYKEPIIRQTKSFAVNHNIMDHDFVFQPKGIENV